MADSAPDSASPPQQELQDLPSEQQEQQPEPERSESQSPSSPMEDGASAPEKSRSSSRSPPARPAPSPPAGNTPPKSPTEPATKPAAAAPPAPVPVASKEPHRKAPSGPPAPETPQEKKAKDYMVQAEKKLKSSQSFFGGLFGSAAKMEDAADLYVRAANSFKVAKKWRASGDAFCLAAEVQTKLDVKHEAASNLVEAGQVLKKEDPRRAVECYQQAAEIYTDMGRFSMAARYHSNIAEICEGELADFEQAITHYEMAADYFKGEDSTGSANRCLLKVAHMSAQLQHFEKAAGIFEEVGRNSLENNLLRYSAKDHFFKASICWFCIGVEDVTDAIEGYKQVHPGFEGTRELKLVQDLLVAHSEEDPDKFSDIIKDYDAISRIDQWLTTQLLHIKKTIAQTSIN